MDTALEQPAEAPKERIVVLDVLRGLAVFGILVANIQFFGGWYPEDPERTAASTADRWLDFALSVFVEGKFLSTFAMLFGYGFAIMMLRAGPQGTARFVRRCIGLIVIGLLHGIFLSVGDVLLTYGVVGFALLGFRNRRAQTIGWWIFGLALGLVVFGAIGALVLAFIDFGAVDPFGDDFEGSFGEVTGARLVTVLLSVVGLPFVAATVLPLFLVGLLAARWHFASDPGRAEPVLRRAWRWGLGLGLPLSALLAVGHHWLFDKDSIAGALCLGAIALLAPVVAVGACAWLVHRSARGLPRWLVALTAPVGRLALTNYLVQSAVCTWVFYGYGLGHYGEWHLVQLVGLAVAVYAAQVLLSVAWMRVFAIGPAEWLLRTITYARPQRLLRAN